MTSQSFFTKAKLVSKLKKISCLFNSDLLKEEQRYIEVGNFERVLTDSEMTFPSQRERDEKEKVLTFM